MEFLSPIYQDYNWGGLISLVIKLAVFYSVLILSQRLMMRMNKRSQWQNKLHTLIRYSLLVFEPIAILVIGSYFVLVQPLLHGLLVLSLVTINFRHLKNYYSGRLVLFDNAIRIGNRLYASPHSGIIKSIDRMGLRLQTNKGIHVISHDTLLQEGYTLLSGDQSRGFYRLRIGSTDNNKEQMLQVLEASPYINWKHRPKIAPHSGDDNHWNVELSLFDEQHLDDLILHLEEQGLSCQIAKN